VKTTHCLSSKGKDNMDLYGA